MRATIRETVRANTVRETVRATVRETVRANTVKETVRTTVREIVRANTLSILLNSLKKKNKTQLTVQLSSLLN